MSCPYHGPCICLFVGHNSQCYNFEKQLKCFFEDVKSMNGFVEREKEK